MNPDEIDKEIINIIKKDPEMPYSRIAELLQISEEEVKEKLEMLSDTRQKILIVDDELDTLIPLKRALEAEDYLVVEASSGMEAIEKTRSNHPDLILLDLMMPGMDGFEVCNVLKDDTLTGSIPIIMLTAKGEIDDKIEGIETGADDYVTKPFDLSELKARIKMILRRTGV
ncbi:MAG TPA: response regulator [Methanosarcinales archaeon]|nr:response regulator [Methanosarcinales archaeon]